MHTYDSTAPDSSTSEAPKKLTNPLQRFFRTVRKINVKAFALAIALLAAVGVTTFATGNPTGVWFTRASGEGKITYTADQVVTEDGQNYSENAEYWFGNGQSRDKSYTGLHFSGEPLPAGASIKKVELVFTSSKNQWISQASKIYIQNTDRAALFSSGDRPSNRALTADSVKYTDNKEWKSTKEYTLPSLRNLGVVLQNHKGSFALIIKGTGGSWGRKYFMGVGAGAPRLVVTYTTDNPNVTPLPSANPVPTATPGPTPGSTPPPSTQPSTPPTGSPAPTPAPTADPHAGHDMNSHAMGLWNPTRFDTCPNPADTARIKTIHDSYSVVGPDGKRYPTWHPPVDPATGCKFGHEHGRDPKGYQYWDEVRRNFAYDADSNGQISDAELLTAGIPFGYVNEQLDMENVGMMRHEDHVGHKIEFANGEGDIGSGTDPFDKNMTGGVVVPVKATSGGAKWNQSGVRCYHFHKIHQGVHSPDAFGNNLHEVIMHTKCSSTRTDFPASTTLLSGMIAFGAPGELTRFCGADRNTIVTTGKTAANQNWPGTRNDGMRNIITRDCVEQTVLVPDGQWSSFPYEIWSGALRIRTANNAVIAENLGGSWEILDAIRYYNPAAPNKISYIMDTCYETLGNRRTRGGACDWGTNYGQIKGITWDDPRSPFRGVKRGQYITPHTINNAGGPQYWYTDAFGKKASQTPFPGSIRQVISPVRATVTFSSDPRIIGRDHNDGGRTVHAPN